MITVKLWRFSLEDTKEVLYLYSLRSDEAYLRHAFYWQDEVDMDCDTYGKLYSIGKIEKIDSIEQVSENDYDILPYHTDEISNNIFEIPVKHFLSEEVESFYERGQTL